MSSPPSGTFFILYDFIKYFKKDNPSFLPRKDFLEIIDTIFGSQWPVSQLEKDAIIFQVKPFFKMSIVPNRELKVEIANWW